MGQIPAKSFLPPVPYGASQGVNALNPSQPAAQNPQTPLLPPNFTDPGTMMSGATQSAATGGTGSNPFGGGGGGPVKSPFSQMFGKGLFGILLLMLAPSMWATTTVTGTLQNLGTSTVGQGAFVRFWLRGCGGNIPRVNGTAAIAPSQGGVYFFDMAANSSGVISGTLYSTRDAAGTGNGDIECGGSKLSVWYGMQVFVGGKGGVEVPVHAKNSVTLDISNVTPITTNPVVTSPTGDSTYARLDAGNQPFTGNVQSPRFISTIATGTAPLAVASTTNVANLNASSLGGATFASPGPIGGTTPSTVTATALISASPSPATSGIIRFANGDFVNAKSSVAGPDFNVIGSGGGANDLVVIGPATPGFGVVIESGTLLGHGNTSFGPDQSISASNGFNLALTSSNGTGAGPHTGGSISLTPGTGNNGGANGTISLAAGPIATGTAAVLTGTGACATFSTQTGGSWAGRATCTAGTAASTLTITPGTTAPNGWICYVQDQTTRANLLQQTSNTTTACTLTAASVTQNDVFVFTAIAF